MINATKHAGAMQIFTQILQNANVIMLDIKKTNKQLPVMHLVNMQLSK